MHDYGLGVLKSYGLSANHVFRGRGALICDTDQGLKIIQEYWGSPAKLKMQYKLQKHCKENGFAIIDQVLENSESQLVTMNEEGIPYMVRDWFAGRECNVHATDDVISSAVTLARLHKVMRIEMEDVVRRENPLEECKKHNRELRRVRKYLQKKKRKNEFEEKLASSISLFLQQAEEITEKMEQAGYDNLLLNQKNAICHGECNQHNFIFTESGVGVTNFGKWKYGIQTTDICQFVRKVLEKHEWNAELGKRLIEVYNKERFLSEEERLNLYYQLAYPWKFWKIVNYYAGNNKIWISQKNLEKLELTVRTYDKWQSFLLEMMSA